MNDAGIEVIHLHLREGESCAIIPFEMQDVSLYGVLCATPLPGTSVLNYSEMSRETGSCS